MRRAELKERLPYYIDNCLEYGVSKRNQSIGIAFLNGVSIAELAIQYKISEIRVLQILSNIILQSKRYCDKHAIKIKENIF